jgi:hypothetical protein
MPFFTVIVEVDGGTDISQFETADHVAAIGAWCDRTRAMETAGPDSSGLAGAVERSIVGGTTLLPLDWLRNVWCHTALYGNELVFVNVVDTRPA